METIGELFELQGGVIARRQLLAAGYEPHDVRRMVRAKELEQLFPGVLVNHTGAPTWIQRAWGAVLYAWPAALADESALRAAERRRWDSTLEEPIQLAIDRQRNLKAAPGGIEVVRRVRLDDDVQWNAGPPRLRYEEAVLDRALAADDEVDAVAILSGACGSPRTTAARLADALERRARARRRRWTTDVLRDIAEGTHSALEHGYLTRVERPHGLPRGRRQVLAEAPGGSAYRDVDLDRIVIELDGRIYHESSARRDADLERDLDVLGEGRQTARLGWGQVYRRPCATAIKIARVLSNAGWEGSPQPCASPDCAVRAVRGP
ncbi:type IV toxin-antitoxin system AbiEi family antitoxin domain-containing protein [Mumia qirimensis]|uniref:type IV toxin-antitoxin system AbiEi family antitoxin domain-containing protein n=1 Tax=Mumia qirimensis TaxID=3234852 RepID=UPI00351D24CE